MKSHATANGPSFHPVGGEGMSQSAGQMQAHIEFVESIANASIDSMVALDTELKIVSWNDTAALWYEKPREEVLGKPFFAQFPNARKMIGLESALHNALEGRKSFLPVTSDFYLNGHFETHYVPLKRKSGEIWGVLQIMHDVAHRIKAEDELKLLNNQLSLRNTALQHANEELATFAKIASHDLKEPLRKIYTFSEFIIMREAANLSTNGRSYFKSIQKSAQRMGLLTDDIASFSELSRNTEPLQHVQLSEIVKNAIESFNTEISQTQAVFHVGDLPEFNGYKAALTQLFRELTDNAIKFRKRDGAPEITISYREIESRDLTYPEVRPDISYYCIEFKDNGIGFDTAYSTRIFGLFQRLHTDGPHRGSGMGLAIALKAARINGGFMKAKSEPGEGSTFYCYLPSSDI